jgi:hypothetical protein
VAFKWDAPVQALPLHASLPLNTRSAVSSVTLLHDPGTRQATRQRGNTLPGSSLVSEDLSSSQATDAATEHTQAQATHLFPVGLQQRKHVKVDGFLETAAGGDFERLSQDPNSDQEVAEPFQFERGSAKNKSSRLRQQDAGQRYNQSAMASDTARLSSVHVPLSTAEDLKKIVQVRAAASPGCNKVHRW